MIIRNNDKNYAPEMEIMRKIANRRSGCTMQRRCKSDPTTFLCGSMSARESKSFPSRHAPSADGRLQLEKAVLFVGGNHQFLGETPHEFRGGDWLALGFFVVDVDGSEGKSR